MAYNIYKTKAAMVVYYSFKTKNNNKIPIIVMQFAPFLKKNDNGFGQQYDWKNKKISMNFSLAEVLRLAISIELSLRDSDWSRCDSYHQYKDADAKTLKINSSGDSYFLTVTSGQEKLTLAFSLLELLSLKEYFKFAALSSMIVDGERYFNEIQNSGTQTTETTDDLEYNVSEDTDFPTEEPAQMKTTANKPQNKNQNNKNSSGIDFDSF